MMKKGIIAVLLCIALTVSNLFSFSVCMASVQEEDLMKGVKKQGTAPCADTSAGNSVLMDFSLRLFQRSLESGKNIMISPVSVLYALAMTENGARGDTLSQMEEVLGMPVSELNNYLCAYAESLPSEEKSKLNIANSVWFKDDGRLTVNPDFLQTNADYYNAGVYKAAFDSETVDSINSWVRDNTDGMIDAILDEISADVVMYLVNAVCFDAEWSDIYSTDQIRKGTFTLENNDTREVEYMYSEEGKYLKDEKAEGFLKYYAGKKYAFAALLPDEKMSIKEYAESLTGEQFRRILENAEDTIVEAAIPKFKSEYEVEMSSILIDMGIVDAFGAKADLSGIGESAEGNLSIGRVLHKSQIEVDERGTKAGAATAVEIVLESVMMSEKQVYLDRPFVYAIIDCETNTPVFMGTMMDVESR